MPDWYLLRRSLAESMPTQTDVPTIIGTKRLISVTAASHTQPIKRLRVKRTAIQVFIDVWCATWPNAKLTDDEERDKDAQSGTGG